MTKITKSENLSSAGNGIWGEVFKEISFFPSSLFLIKKIDDASETEI